MTAFFVCSAVQTLIDTKLGCYNTENIQEILTVVVDVFNLFGKDITKFMLPLICLFTL